MTPPPLSDAASTQTPRASRASLSDVHRTVPAPITGSFWRRLFAFVGPGYLVAVGYMDPGNWATDLSAGSQFGYTLLSVVLLSSLAAMLLQTLSARLGIATGRDLAQMCGDHYGRKSRFGLWFAAELAIIATDLAELIGTAIALQLLFGIPLIWGVCLTVLDTFLVLWLRSRGFRKLEAFIIGLLALIGGCFAAQMWMSQPDVGGVLAGYLPSSEILTNSAMLYVAMGIVGATVMPHNLYLHSSIIQTRAFDRTDEGKRQAARFATIDAVVALSFAMLVNSAILILAAAAFHARGVGEVAEIQEAHRLLAPLLGASAASFLFALALLAAGQNSAVTATMAGEIVMEGFLDIRLRPVLRRLVTRVVAIIPAVIVTAIYGESGTGRLLVLSQVVLSMQLPFAVIPLVRFTADRARMGALVSPRWLSAAAWVVTAVLVGLNLKLLWDVFSGGAGALIH